MKAPRYGTRAVVVIHDGRGSDRLLTTPNADLDDLTDHLPPEAVTRSRRVPGGRLVRVEYLPDVEARAQRDGWFIVRSAAPRPTGRTDKRST